MTNTFSGIRTFMKTDIIKSGDKPICIAGACYDLGASNRSGQRFGPSAVRDASLMLTDGHNPYTEMSYAEILENVGDIGDFSVDKVIPLAILEREMMDAVAQSKLITVGGDHTVTLPLLRAHFKRYGKLSLAHFDAHIDAWDGGKTPNHGNFLRLAIEEDLVDPAHTIQVGLRSSSPKSNHAWLLDQGVTQYSALDVHKMKLTKLADEIVNKTSDVPTYFTFDIDCLDASQAPGSGTPEIGGPFTWQVMEIFRQLNFRNKKIIGADLVEVCPAYDVAQITALAGATIIWNMLSLMDI